ncbi:signal transduction histidine kinase-like protein [Salinisphaera sp. PC39]|uniref:ATP-binding protein n=1 Tax=Salinisphaera sp. PC39 TaxID=1304156 RepID=UPI00333EC871
MRATAALLLWAVVMAAVAETPSSVPVLHHDATVTIDSAVRATPGGDTRRVSLPDDWRRTLARYGGAAWYRFAVDVPEPGERLGIYIPRACNSPWVYVNGDLVGSGGSPWSGPRVHRQCYLPFLFSVPAGVQRAGRNDIAVRVFAYPSHEVASEQRGGRLSTIRVGDYARLREAYLAERTWHVSSARFISAVLAFFGLVMAVLWSNMRRDLYAYFAAALLIGAILVARIYVVDLPLDNVTLERLTLVLTYGIGLTLWLSLFRFADMRLPRFERLLWGGSALGAVAALTIPAGYLRLLGLVSFTLVMLSGLVVLFLLGRHLHRKRGRHLRFYYAGLAVILATTVVEYLSQVHAIPSLQRPVLHVTVPLLFVLFSFRLIDNYAKALRRAERVSEELREQVALIKREVEVAYQKQARAEQARAAQEERERIARDLHDDLGARLLTLVHTARESEIASQARAALGDLRSLIVGMESDERLPLVECLVDWRAEARQRCEAAEVALTWEMSGPMHRHDLNPRQRITVERLIREGITNALKHAAPARIRIAAEVGDKDLTVRIADDGAGAPVTAWRPGVGMRSLQMRARQLGGTIAWRDIEHDGRRTGTELILTLPLT